MSTIWFQDGAPVNCDFSLSIVRLLYEAAMTKQAEVRIRCLCGRRWLLFDITTIDSVKTFATL